MPPKLASLPLVLFLVVSAPSEGANRTTHTNTSGDRGAAAPRLQAAPLAGEIEFGGTLREPAWEQAPLATGFVQREPSPGTHAAQWTEVRVFHGESEKAIYVGAQLYDYSTSLAAQLALRDEPGSYSEHFVAAFDTHYDNRTDVTSGTNPRGVRIDLRISTDTHADLSWSAVWEVRTRADSLGWTAEFRISPTQIRYAPERSTWSAQLQRVITRWNERAFWVSTSPDAPGLASRFGTLCGLLELAAPQRLEVASCAVNYWTHAPGNPENPFYSPQTADLTSKEGSLAFDGPRSTRLPPSSMYAAAAEIEGEGEVRRIVRHFGRDAQEEQATRHLRQMIYLPGESLYVQFSRTTEPFRVVVLPSDDATASLSTAAASVSTRPLHDISARPSLHTFWISGWKQPEYVLRVPPALRHLTLVVNGQEIVVALPIGRTRLPLAWHIG